MAKTKQHNGSTSAAQRREQVRQQRQKQQVSSSSTSSQPQRSRNVRKTTARRGLSSWLVIGGVLVGLAVIVGVFFIVSNQQSNTNNNVTQQTTDPQVLKMVTTVSPSVLSQVGTGGVQAKNSLKSAPAGTPLLTGPKGKPEFFYYGAEFCPYCAAQRWAVVVALSRFGTFTQLPQTTSSSTDVYPNTATFTFYHSAYSSPYIDFVSIEEQDRQNKPLQTPTADEKQILTRYNVTGYPFIDIADRYVIPGPLFDPGILNNMSQKDIASQLSNPGSNITQNIVGSANYITASICAATQNQPASVCTTEPVSSIEKSLPRASVNPTGPFVATIDGQLEMLTRRQD